MAVIVFAGIFGLFYWFEGFALPKVRLFRLVLLLPLYSFLQAVPLPVWLVWVLSPNRAALTDAVGLVLTKPNWTALSVTPSQTTYHCLWFCACVIVFVAGCGLSQQFRERRWVLAVPLLALATLEAAIGVVQLIGRPDAVAMGTYEIRNHFAGLLEMALPFACLYTVHALRRHSYVPAAGGMGSAALMVVGILASQSRMGLFGAVASLLLMGVLAGAPRGRMVTLGIAASIVIGFALLLPTQLLSRLADLAGGDEGRAQVWLETLPLIKAYPLFGCGLGCYESAFTLYKQSSPMLNQDYVHNDYLQYLAELGAIGFAILVTPGVMVVSGLRRSLIQSTRETKWLTLACCGSVFAIALHSLVDFNLYVPANMMVLAWVLGISASLSDAAQ